MAPSRLLAGPPTFLVTQRDADPGREVLDGLLERQPVDLLQERDDVAALVAAEAVPQADLGAHVEGW